MAPTQDFTRSERTNRRGFLRWALAAVLLLAAIAGGMVWRHKAAPRHFATVEEGVLYRSGLMRAHNVEEVIERHGIRTFVNLLPPDPDDDPEVAERLAGERRVCAELGVEHVDIEMQAETPPSDAQLAQWLALLDDPVHRPILVHCEHGVIRTGMMVSVFEIERGGDNQQVMDTLPMFGHDLYKPGRERMREFILGYESRAEAASAADAAVSGAGG